MNVISQTINLYNVYDTSWTFLGHFYGVSWIPNAKLGDYVLVKRRIEFIEGKSRSKKEDKLVTNLSPVFVKNMGDVNLKRAV